MYGHHRYYPFFLLQVDEVLIQGSQKATSNSNLAETKDISTAKAATPRETSSRPDDDISNSHVVTASNPPVSFKPAIPAPGPAPGPTPMPTVSSPTTLPEPEDDIDPSSPHTSTRLQVRNLTMPPVPNFDIPASPPGSPPAGSTKKFTQFLTLKKQGIHFNERLLGSSALRNPELVSKLMGFAGISQEEQYISSLPEELAVRTQFPPAASVDQLIKAHRNIAAKRESDQKGKRDRLEFVPGKSEGGDASGQPVKKKSKFHG